MVYSHENTVKRCKKYIRIMICSEIGHSLVVVASRLEKTTNYN